MSAHCLICERIELIKTDQNPDFVAELETGYVVIGWYQYCKGYSLFFCKEHVTELHDLEARFKVQHLKEMCEVAEAVYRAFRPRKMNYELLGNTDAHVHWHLVPRHQDDPAPGRPIWVIDPSVREAESTKPSLLDRETMKRRLLAQLEKTSQITRRYSE